MSKLSEFFSIKIEKEPAPVKGNPDEAGLSEKELAELLQGESKGPVPAKNRPAPTPAGARVAPLPAGSLPVPGGSPVPPPAKPAGPAMPRLFTFEEIYTAGKVPAPPNGNGVNRVLEMLANPRLAALDPATRATSATLALEAMGVQRVQVVADARARGGALQDYDAFLSGKVDALVTAKAAENQAAQAEIEEFVRTKKAQIEKNLGEIRVAQETLVGWRGLKETEISRMQEAVNLFGSENGAPFSGPPQGNPFGGR